jgi:hypothetical protein
MAYLDLRNWLLKATFIKRFEATLMRSTVKIYVLWRGKMSRRPVVEIKCDRCKRSENRDPATLPAQGQKSLIVSFKGQKIEYDDLCTKCETAVENYFKSMTKQLEEPEKAPEKPQEKSGFLGIGGGVPKKT